MPNKSENEANPRDFQLKRRQHEYITFCSLMETVEGDILHVSVSKSTNL